MGQALDVSPHPITDRSAATTCFIVDSTQDFDLSWPPGVGQRHLALVEHPALDLFIKCQMDLEKAQSAYLQAQRAVPSAQFEWQTGHIHSDTAGQQRLALLEGKAETEIQALISRRDTAAAKLPQIRSKFL